MQRRRLTWVFVLAGLAVFGTSACDEADIEKYTATLEGAQENPPVTTGGAGRAVALVSHDGTRVDLTVTLAHIHRAARGSNGGVIHDIWVPNRTIIDDFSVGNPIARTFTFNAEHLNDLRAGNYYVNVHSTFRPGGEIRGQLVRED